MANRVIGTDGGKVEVKDSSLVPFFGVRPILISPKVSDIVCMQETVVAFTTITCLIACI